MVEDGCLVWHSKSREQVDGLAAMIAVYCSHIHTMNCRVAKCSAKRIYLPNNIDVRFAARQAI